MTYVGMLARSQIYPLNAIGSICLYMSICTQTLSCVCTQAHTHMFAQPSQATSW